MNKLNRYKLDKAFTDGVDIRLDDAPDAVFRVRLPSQYNRGYTQALYGSLEWETDDAGNVTPGGGVMTTRWAQEDAFIAHCLVSLDGDPIPDGFVDDYPQALQELMGKAAELTVDIENRVSDSVKKSQATLNGPGDGQEKNAFTESLNKEAG